MTAIYQTPVADFDGGYMGDMIPQEVVFPLDPVHAEGERYYTAILENYALSRQSYIQSKYGVGSLEDNLPFFAEAIDPQKWSGAETEIHNASLQSIQSLPDVLKSIQFGPGDLLFTDRGTIADIFPGYRVGAVNGENVHYFTSGAILTAQGKERLEQLLSRELESYQWPDGDLSFQGKLWWHYDPKHPFKGVWSTEGIPSDNVFRFSHIGIPNAPISGDVAKLLTQDQEYLNHINNFLNQHNVGVELNPIKLRENMTKQYGQQLTEKQNAILNNLVDRWSYLTGNLSRVIDRYYESDKGDGSPLTKNSEIYLNMLDRQGIVVPKEYRSNAFVSRFIDGIKEVGVTPEALYKEHNRLLRGTLTLNYIPKESWSADVFDKNKIVQMSKNAIAPLEYGRQLAVLNGEEAIMKPFFDAQAFNQLELIPEISKITRGIEKRNMDLERKLLNLLERQAGVENFLTEINSSFTTISSDIKGIIQASEASRSNYVNVDNLTRRLEKFERKLDGINTLNDRAGYGQAFEETKGLIDKLHSSFQGILQSPRYKILGSSKEILDELRTKYDELHTSLKNIKESIKKETRSPGYFQELSQFIKETTQTMLREELAELKRVEDRRFYVSPHVLNLLQNHRQRTPPSIPRQQLRLGDTIREVGHINTSTNIRDIPLVSPTTKTTANSPPPGELSPSALAGNVRRTTRGVNTTTKDSVVMASKSLNTVYTDWGRDIGISVMPPAPPPNKEYGIQYDLLDAALNARQTQTHNPDFRVGIIQTDPIAPPPRGSNAVQVFPEMDTVEIQADLPIPPPPVPEEIETGDFLVARQQRDPRVQHWYISAHPGPIKSPLVDPGPQVIFTRPEEPIIPIPRSLWDVPGPQYGAPPPPPPVGRGPPAPDGFGGERDTDDEEREPDTRRTGLRGGVGGHVRRQRSAPTVLEARPEGDSEPANNEEVANAPPSTPLRNYQRNLPNPNTSRLDQIIHLLRQLHDDREKRRTNNREERQHVNDLGGNARDVMGQLVRGKYGGMPAITINATGGAGGGGGSGGGKGFNPFYRGNNYSVQGKLKRKKQKKPKHSKTTLKTSRHTGHVSLHSNDFITSLRFK